MKLQSSVLFALASLAATAVPAHHNAAAHYLTDKTATVEGVVTEFRLINPHARIYLQVKDASGKYETWMSEGDAAAVLLRRGWTANDIKKGDKVKITGHPSRNGSKMIEWKSIILPNGTELGGGNNLTDERARHLEELDRQRRSSSQQKPPG